MSFERLTKLIALAVLTFSPGLAVAQEVWSAGEGTVTLTVPYDTLEEHGLWIAGRAVPTTSGDLVMTLTLTLDEAADLEFTVDTDGKVRLSRRHLSVLEGITISTSEANHPVFDLTIAAGEEVGPEGIDDLQGIARGIPTLELRGMKAGFNHRHNTLTVAGREVVITPELADALGRPELAGVSLGLAVVSAVGEWIGGDAPAPFDPFLPDGGDVTRGIEGPDCTFCQLYDFRQFGQRSGIVGLSIATTSWNIGNADLEWFGSPDNRHPFIVMDLFRLKTVDGSERFEQIGQSWIKHAFTALSSTQCGGSCTFEPGHTGGNWLGMNCTDTYGASLNADQGGLGPRFEVDPWTGVWSYQGSHFQQGGGGHDWQIDHRLQVHDADLSGQPAGTTYYGSSFYVARDDVDAMNSNAWKQTTVSGSPGNWSFGMSGSGTFPNIGFAIDAWTGAQQTKLAEEIPPIEFVSPDGRCVLAAKATDLGGGAWHYEYALLNIDMDRQVGSFSIMVRGRIVTNVGFHAVEHHDEPFNTVDADKVAIDNQPWTSEVTGSGVTWSTTTNPLRWGTMYNFRFDADGAPDPDDVGVTLGLFRPGTPSTVTGATVGPLVAPAPCDSDPDLCIEYECAYGICDGNNPAADENGCLWQNYPATRPCGDPSDTDCDNPDTCDGAGGCRSNAERLGEACDLDSNACTIDECNGTGDCVHVDDVTCQPADPPCEGGEECNSATGDCDALPDSPSGTPCGDPSDTDCTDPDTCDDGATCQAHNQPNGTGCDDGEECTTNDRCTGGVCGGTYQGQLFGDIKDSFCPPICPQPDLDDINCVVDDFADGPGVDGCAGGVHSTDLAPCGGNGTLDLDDILVMLDAFSQIFACPHPCP